MIFKKSFKRYALEFYNRNKYHVLLSLVIFVTFLILSYFYPSFFNNLMHPAMTNMRKGVSNGTIILDHTALFTNNFSVALNIYTSGIFFSIQSVYILIYNALLVGYTGAHMKFLSFIAYTLPHGIFELTGIIISGAASLRLTQAILTLIKGFVVKSDDRKNTISQHIDLSFKIIIDSLILMLIVLVLLFVAGYIEANLTVSIGKALTGH